MPYYSVADGFHTKKFFADFLQAKLHGKRPFCVFEPPLGEGCLEATYNVHAGAQAEPQSHLLVPYLNV